MLPLSRRSTGIIQTVLSGIGFGFIGVFGKRAFAAGLQPGELLALRFLVSSLLMAGGLALFSPDRLKLPWRAVAASSLLGTLGYAVFAGCFYAALGRLSASLTVLLLYTYPVMVTVGAAVFFKERLTKRLWCALPLAVLGMCLLVLGDSSTDSAPGRASDLLGLCLGILSAVFYSLYILASSRLLKRVQPLSSAFYVQFSAGVALGVTYLGDTENVRTVFNGMAGTQALAAVIGTAILSTALPITFFLSGLQKLRSSEASILSTAEPLTAITAAYFLLGERLGIVQALGALAVLCTLILVSTEKKRSNKLAECPPSSGS